MRCKVGVIAVKGPILGYFFAFAKISPSSKVFRKKNCNIAKLQYVLEMKVVLFYIIFSHFLKFVVNMLQQ